MRYFLNDGEAYLFTTYFEKSKQEKSKCYMPPIASLSFHSVKNAPDWNNISAVFNAQRHEATKHDACFLYRFKIKFSYLFKGKVKAAACYSCRLAEVHWYLYVPRSLSGLSTMLARAAGLPGWRTDPSVAIDSTDTIRFFSERIWQTVRGGRRHHKVWLPFPWKGQSWIFFTSLNKWN